MRSMVYFCQSVFLKICFVIALDVLRDLPTVDTITIESPVSSTNTLLINPSSTTSDGISFQTSILSFTTSNAHSTFTVSETTTHYEPSSGVSSDHSTLLPSFSTSKVSSLFMSTATTPYLSTLHPSSQRSTLSSESIRYSTTIDIHSSSHASHMPTISTNAMSPVVSSLTFSSTVSSAHSTASFSSSQTLPVTSVTVSGSYLTTPSTEGITTSMISPKVSSTSVDTYSTTSLRMQSSISFVSNTSPTTASTTAETSTLGAIKDANNDGLVLGLSIGLSVAVVAIVCLLIVVIFWKRCGHRKALDTRTETSPKSKCCAVSKISTVENYTRAYKDNCRYILLRRRNVNIESSKKNPESPVKAKTSHKKVHFSHREVKEPHKEPRPRITAQSDFLEFKRGKREERKKRLEESVAQKKELYIKSSPSSGPKIDKFLSPLNYD